MSKLPKHSRFLDLSDYGRPFARHIAMQFKETSITPIHITLAFIISGLIAANFILMECYWAAALFLILKSILDAADGELARIKKTPSYTGRFLDSIADIILNAIFFTTIWCITEISMLYVIISFFGIQLQGTLYNYYYTILRNNSNGDTTSRIFENDTPRALKGEKQSTVTRFFIIYKVLYGVFDRIIYYLDYNASQSKQFPKWFMTFVSTFGLGFQLLLISVMLVTGMKEYIIPFFIYYSLMIFVFIGFRKLFL